MNTFEFNMNPYNYSYSEWALNVYGIYSLLIMNKYLGVILSIFKTVDSKIFAAEKLEEEETPKDSSAWEIYGQVKSWLIAASGVAAAYATGTTSYILPLVNLTFTTISNLPMFTRVGAPFLCIVMKLYGFKLPFLRGWFVLSLSMIAVFVFQQFIFLNSNVLRSLLFIIPGQTFIAYHTTYEEIMGYLERMARFVINLDYLSFAEDIVDEIVTNG